MERASRIDDSVYRVTEKVTVDSGLRSTPLFLQSASANGVPSALTIPNTLRHAKAPPGSRNTGNVHVSELRILLPTTDDVRTLSIRPVSRHSVARQLAVNDFPSALSSKTIPGARLADGIPTPVSQTRNAQS